MKKENGREEDELNQDTESFEKSTKKIFFIALGLIILIILFILFGANYFYMKKKPQTTTYNEFEFEFIDGRWYTQWQSGNNIYQIPLKFNPFEVENVPIKGTLNPEFNDKPIIYIAIDPFVNDKYLTLAVSELSLNLVRVLNKNIEAVCTKENPEVCANRTVINCDSKENAVIEFLLEGDPEIIAKDNCVVLKGQDLNVMKSTDKFLYKWYGIIK